MDKCTLFMFFLALASTMSPATANPQLNKAKTAAGHRSLQANNMNERSLDALDAAARDEIGLYHQVQEAAIGNEFATADAKLGKDKEKSVSGRSLRASNGRSLNWLQAAARDAVDLYGQVQKLAIDYEFATARAKLGNDKAKGVSGRSLRASTGRSLNAWRNALQAAARDAIALYGEVQKAAISYEFATVGAKIGKD